MSNNYLPTPATDIMEHLRYFVCTISRPYGDDKGQPYAGFNEEHILENQNGKQTEPRGSIGTGITDSNEETEFDIINPGTLAPTGKTMTYAELLQGIDSLYYHLAKIRDAEAVPEQMPAHTGPGKPTP